MKLGIFAIKDVGAGEFNTPFFQPRVEHAVRIFRTEVNRANDQNLVYLYPKEFELWQVGVFDQDTGQLVKDVEPVRLTGGEELKAKS